MVSELAGSVPTVQRAPALAACDRDAEARAWIQALRSDGAEREGAAARLHALLLRAARFELARRRVMLDGLAREPIKDVETRERLRAIMAAIRTELSPHQREVLIAALLGPVGPELTCEQCFELLDVYVEHELAAENADRLVEGLRAHLTGWPACAEELASLLELVATLD